MTINLCVCVVLSFFSEPVSTMTQLKLDEVLYGKLGGVNTDYKYCFSIHDNTIPKGSLVFSHKKINDINKSGVINNSDDCEYTKQVCTLDLNRIHTYNDYVFARVDGLRLKTDEDAYVAITTNRYGCEICVKPPFRKYLFDLAVIWELSMNVAFVLLSIHNIFINIDGIIFSIMFISVCNVIIMYYDEDLMYGATVKNWMSDKSPTALYVKRTIFACGFSVAFVLKDESTKNMILCFLVACVYVAFSVLAFTSELNNLISIAMFYINNFVLYSMFSPYTSPVLYPIFLTGLIALLMYTINIRSKSYSKFGMVPMIDFYFITVFSILFMYALLFGLFVD